MNEYNLGLESLNDNLLAKMHPRSANKNQLNYFYKTYLDSGEFLVKMVIADGVDNYNRAIAKSYNLILSEEEYFKHGLLFFLNPLLSGKLNPRSNKLLDYSTDFSLRSPRITFTVKQLLQAVLTYEHVNIFTTITTQEAFNYYAELLATIDQCLPPELNRILTLKSLMTKQFLNEFNLGVIIDQQVLDEYKQNNNQTIIFKAEKSFFDFDIYEKSLEISPIIDDIVNSLINPTNNHISILQELFNFLLSSDALKDPRIEFNFYSRFLQRFNVRMTRSSRIRGYFKI